MDSLENGKEYFNYRLYRQHTSHCGNIKDLNVLGRDLSKVIIVDNLEDNFQTQPSNGLKIMSWEGNVYDCELKSLIHILSEIYEKRVDDVRKVVNKVKIEMNNCRTNSFSNIDINTICM